MLIIGHRGARGLVTENTLESIQKAIDLGADAVEFDVWTTKDGVPVLQHDESLFRMTGDPHTVNETSRTMLEKIRTRDGKVIPTARQAIELIGRMPFYFEVKDWRANLNLIQLLRENQHKNMTITSFEWPTLLEIKKALPNLTYYAATSRHPLKVISFARQYGLGGITLKYFWLSPLTYWLTKHHGLRIALYAVNSSLYVKLLKFFKYDVDIYTDFPDRFVKQRSSPLPRERQ